MKSTGIVRRIDELGRLVIPKEIRKNLHIREGESVEIYTDSENIILRKFSIIKNVSEVAQNYVDSIYSILKTNIIITDSSNIIAVNNKNKKLLLNGHLSNYLISLLKSREILCENNFHKLEITNQYMCECYYFINPIIIDGDIVGLIILYDENKIISNEKKEFINFCTMFLQNYLSN